MTTTPPPMPEPICSKEIADMQGYLDAVREMRSGFASVHPDRIAQWMERITALEAQKQELREALQRILDWDAAGMAVTGDHIDQADTALRNTN
jgi:hypothetical protein